jgi:hypothetical protein
MLQRNGSFHRQRTSRAFEGEMARCLLLYKGGGRQSTHLHHVVRQLRVISSHRRARETVRCSLISGQTAFVSNGPEAAVLAVEGAAMHKDRIVDFVDFPVGYLLSYFGRPIDFRS